MSGWKNDITATYIIKRAKNARLKLPDIAQKMADGISIGTTQEAVGTYTPKRSAINPLSPIDRKKKHKFKPGYLRASMTGFCPLGDEAVFKVKFSSQIFGEIGGFPMLMAALVGDQFGTAYECDSARLIDLQMPDEYIKQFPGPWFGVKGMRKLYGIKTQPMAAVLLKPNTGQSPEHYAYIAEQAACGGASYIKDDEMKVNTKAHIAAITDKLSFVKHAQGRQTLYGPNITVGYRYAENHVRMVVEEAGATAIMVNAVHAGLEYVRWLVESSVVSVPIHVHRTGHDAITRGEFGMSLAVFTKLWRMAGADQIHIGPVFGGLYRPSEIKEIFNETKLPLGHCRSSLPVISRANVDVIQGCVDYLGTLDLLFLCDDGVYKHEHGLKAGMAEVCNLLDKVQPGTLSRRDAKYIYENNNKVRFV